MTNDKRIKDGQRVYVTVHVTYPNGYVTNVTISSHSYQSAMSEVNRVYGAPGYSSRTIKEEWK